MNKRGKMCGFSIGYGLFFEGVGLGIQCFVCVWLRVLNAIHACVCDGMGWDVCMNACMHMLYD